MSAIGEAVRALMDAGVAQDDIIAAIDRMVAALPLAETAEERRRRVSRESSARHREKARDENRSPNVTGRHQTPVTDRDENRSPVTEIGHDTSPPRARVEVKYINSSPTLAVAAVVDASARDDDWPRGEALDHQALLIAEAATQRLDPARESGLIVTLGRLHAWRRDGASWTHDVVPVVTAMARKRGPPIKSWKFFDAAIAQSIADNAAALTIPEARHASPADDRSPSAKLSAKRENHARHYAGAEQAAELVAARRAF